MKAIKILRNMMSVDHGILYNPEDYAIAGGELLVLSMFVSWIITYFFNPAFIESNPLKDRAGFNNLCVGWDTFPAKYFAAPMFSLIIFFEARFMQLDWWRAALDTTLTSRQRKAVLVSNVFSAISWFGSIGIFSIDAMVWPLGHTASFVQLVVFGYIAFVANFIETDPRYHPRGSWIFVGVFGVVSMDFGACAMIQMVAYDPATKTRGPVPVLLLQISDYGYFLCMGVQGMFRPAAPSLQASYRIVSDDDYKLPDDRAQVSSALGRSEPPAGLSEKSNYVLGCCCSSGSKLP
mmetsp:Transcript_70841/g.230144  ORF Transcript_70841/g.230144 Transcript_70841/m.230144 type:complete len:292 (+) Transcript_70841:119-994(+)